MRSDNRNLFYLGGARALALPLQRDLHPGPTQCCCSSALGPEVKPCPTSLRMPALESITFIMEFQYVLPALGSTACTATVSPWGFLMIALVKNLLQCRGMMGWEDPYGGKATHSEAFWPGEFPCTVVKGHSKESQTRLWWDFVHFY